MIRNRTTRNMIRILLSKSATFITILVSALIVSSCTVRSTPEKSRDIPPLFSRDFALSQCSNAEIVSIHCGKAPFITFDADNRLWAVFELNDFVYLTYSDNFGKRFNTPVAVNLHPEKIYTNGENRPKIAIGNNGEIYISWTQKTSGRYTGDIRFSRSLDKGQTFSPVITVNDDGLITSHRFDSLSVSKNGSVFISWLDKRDQVEIMTGEMTKESMKMTSATEPESDQDTYFSRSNVNPKKPKPVASVYYAISTNSGKTFQKNRKLAESTCVCCRIAMEAMNDGQIAIFWRHIFTDRSTNTDTRVDKAGKNTADHNIRDHAFAIINDQGISLPPQRATRDNWKIDACPHHGPSLYQDAKDNFHIVWFTASDSRKGIYYSQYNFVSNTSQNLVNVSNLASASHPYIKGNKNLLIIVWKEFDGEKTHIYHQTSVDSGQSWSQPSIVDSTDGDSDHPLLTRQAENITLSWHTKNEGLRLYYFN